MLNKEKLSVQDAKNYPQIVPWLQDSSFPVVKRVATTVLSQ